MRKLNPTYCYPKDNYHAEIGFKHPEKDALSGKTLVTGASGLVGANLVRSLLAQEREVRALVHRDYQALDGLGVETISAEVRDQAALDRAMDGVEVVYHLAGSISLEMDSGPEMEAINALGTRNIVASCLKSNVHRLVHFSSIDALSQESSGKPVDESQPLVDEGLPAAKIAHIPPYDLSKAQGEREVRAGMARGLDAVIIRPTAMLGPYDFKPSYLGQALLMLAKGMIPALVKGGFDWVDVRDVVAGALRAEQAAPPGSCFILGGNWHTLREVAQMVSSYTGRAAPIVTAPISLADAFAPLMSRLVRFSGGRPVYTRVMLGVLRSNRHVSSGLAHNSLGYTARPMPETVRDTLAWFQERGYLRRNHP